MIGNLYVIAAPSGTGKTTLVHALVQSLTDIIVSISHTTRAKRPAEVDGVNYHFINHETFQEMVEHGDFLEHAVIFNHFYGTSRSAVEQTLARGIDVILEIDWQGAQQIQSLFPESISIFILPPSFKVLSERLHSRNQDNKAIIQARLEDVAETVSHVHEFDYIVVNDDFETALNDLKTIIQAGRLTEARQAMKYDYLISELIQKAT